MALFAFARSPGLDQFLGVRIQDDVRMFLGSPDPEDSSPSAASESTPTPEPGPSVQTTTRSGRVVRPSARARGDWAEDSLEDICATALLAGHADATNRHGECNVY